jgi:cardiolipin synthase A/B
MRRACGGWGGATAKLFKRAALLVMLATGVACRSLPEDPPLPPAGPNQYRIAMRSPSGPVHERDMRRILADLKGQAPDGDSLTRHLATEQAVAASPLYTSNRVQVLRDGEQTFPAMFAAIRGAHHYVLLEYYIFDDIECAGERMSDLLLDKRRQGVAVAVIYDSFGSHDTPQAFFDRLKGGGVQLIAFHPLNPLKPARRYAPNDRDHRKLLVADGEVALVGGVNMSRTYESSRLTGSGAGDAPSGSEHWRDTDLQIAGPVVADLEQQFVAHWVGLSGAPPQGVDYQPAIAARGSETVRIIGSVPSHDKSRYYAALLAALESAQSMIWVTAGYFVPTPSERKALAAAAQRGVDVELLVPAHSDSPAALSVQHSTYEDLLKAGVKIYEDDGVVLHAKTVIVDRVWCAIGSSNFDHRSALYNDELDAVVLGAQTADSLMRLFQDDLKQAHEIDPSAWHHRPVSERVREDFWRIWQRFL